jgi:hypothetical protein
MTQPEVPTLAKVRDVASLEDPADRLSQLEGLLQECTLGVKDSRLATEDCKNPADALKARAHFLAVAKNIIGEMNRLVPKEIRPPKGSKGKVIEVDSIRSMVSERELDSVEREVKTELESLGAKEEPVMAADGSVSF